MSEDEFNAAMAGARQAQSGLGGVLGGLGAGNVCTPPTALTGAANGRSINGLGGMSMPSWVTPADIQMTSLLSQQAPAYGEQGPDTDGLAAIQQQNAAWVRAVQNARLVSDGLEAPLPGISGPPNPPAMIADLEARIARKEAANEALVAKLGAMLADMRSLQRQADNWRAECQRLSALLVETREQLAQRMAIPANALRHGGVR